METVHVPAILAASRQLRQVDSEFTKSPNEHSKLQASLSHTVKPGPPVLQLSEQNGIQNTC